MEHNFNTGELRLYNENDGVISEAEMKTKDLTDKNYQRIRSYLILLRAEVSDQKELGENFFKNHKNEQTVFENLNKITENTKETDDVRLQAIVMLRKLYNASGKYLQYEKPVEDYYGQFPALASEDIILEEKKKKRNLFIDSLPYLDQHYKDEVRVKEEANRLLNEEMHKLSSMKTLDGYLKDLPYPDLKHLEDPLIKSELKRIEKNKRLNAIQNEIITKFENPPPNKYHDYKNWEKLIDNVHLSLQQFNIKNCNLDLLIKYGPEAWKRYLSKLDCVVKQLEREKENFERNCEEVNRERKFKQIEFGEEMKDLESKMNYYIHQNAGIQTECMKLRFKIKKLVKYKKSKLNRKLKVKKNDTTTTSSTAKI